MASKAKRGSGGGANQRTGTAWHQGFAHLVRERHPPSFTSQTEVELLLQPGRVDMVLERRPGEMPRHDQARVMRSLWHRLSRITLLEFKGPTRGHRSSDLLRLENYAGLYFAKHWGDIARRGELTLVLVVPSVNRALKRDIAKLECTWEDLERGYARIDGLGYTTYAVITSEAAEAEDDDYLRFFGIATAREPETMDWLQQWLAYQEQHMPQLKQNKSFQEMRHKYLSSMTPEERLAGLAPEERLAGLAPEERLAGLAPEERLAGLAPEEVLAHYAPEERLAGLAPEEVLARYTPEQLHAYLESLGNKSE